MALTVNWRWNAPQIGGEYAQADSMRSGILGAAKGVADMMRNSRDEKWKEQAQQNWQAQFDQAADQWKKQFDQAADQWKKQFEQSKAVQDFTMNRQKAQDEWLQKWYSQYFGDDPKERRYQELMAKYGGATGDAGLVLNGLNPQLF